MSPAFTLFWPYISTFLEGTRMRNRPISVDISFLAVTYTWVSPPTFPGCPASTSAPNPTPAGNQPKRRKRHVPYPIFHPLSSTNHHFSSKTQRKEGGYKYRSSNNYTSSMNKNFSLTCYLARGLFLALSKPARGVFGGNRVNSCMRNCRNMTGKHLFLRQKAQLNYAMGVLFGSGLIRDVHCDDE